MYLTRTRPWSAAALAVLIALAAVTVTAASAPADETVPHTEPHAHMLVLGVQFDGDEPVGYRRCIDLAANQPVPLNAHHAHLHTGQAGAAQFLKAGNVVVPAAPFAGLPFSNCAELIEMTFGD